MAALPDYSEALAKALQVVHLLGGEDIPLEAAAGRVLAECVAADRDLPPFDRAMMDGYAVRAAEIAPGIAMTVAAAVPAGAAHEGAVPPRHCVRIATGAPVPRGLDAVIPHEWSDRADPVRFTVESVERGHAIHPRGADARQGAIVVTAGALLGPHHLGILASVGAKTTRVRRQPRTIILTSGDEVVATGHPVLSHQIRNSNGIMLRECVRRFGAGGIEHIHLPDEREPTIEAVRDAVARFDLVVTVGGVSVGERDHFPAAYEAARIEMPVRGASIQPGRPIHVGRAPSGTIVVGLPGNPVSALACAHLFIWPIIRAMQGLGSPLPPGEGFGVRVPGDLPWQTRTLRDPVKPNTQRQAFRPATIHADGTVTVPNWAGSGDLVHTATTDGLLELPVQRDPVPAGTRLRFLPWA